MYPFNSDYVFLKDCWYVGAHAHEVADTPLGRKILDQPVVFYRKSDGGAVAVAGLCPHRFFPLSMGRVDGDSLVCRYHGIAFGPDGRCVRVPSQEAPLQYQRGLRVYPVVERGGLIWIWMGEASAANEALLPDLDIAGITAAGFHVHALATIPIAGRYMALIENLADLTHIGFLHASILPGGMHWVSTPLEITSSGDRITVVRRAEGGWDQFLDFQFGAELAIAGMLRMHTRSDFFSPSYVRTSGFIIDGVEGRAAVPATLGQMYYHHFVTPETLHSTHYFAAMSRNYRQEDSAFDLIWDHADLSVRAQDQEAIAALEPMIDQYGDTRIELVTKTDAVAVRIRRAMQRRLNEEQKRHAA